MKSRIDSKSFSRFAADCPSDEDLELRWKDALRLSRMRQCPMNIQESSDYQSMPFVSAAPEPLGAHSKPCTVAQLSAHNSQASAHARHSAGSITTAHLPKQRDSTAHQLRCLPARSRAFVEQSQDLELQVPAHAGGIR